MNKEELKKLLVEHGVPENQVEEMASNFNDESETLTNISQDETQTLKLRLLDETDWRKRAVIAAQLASINLDA